MPAHPPGVRRPLTMIAQAVAAHRRQAPQPPHDAGDAHHRAGDRRPDDDLVPKGRIAAERCEVQPVQDGADPAPEPARCRRFQHDLAAGFGHIQSRALCILDCNTVERHAAAHAKRPLIGVGELRIVADVVKAADERLRDSERVFGIDRRHGVASVAEDQVGAAARGDSKDGPAFERANGESGHVTFSRR